MRKKTLATLSVVLLVVVAGGIGTYASYTATTTNSANAISSGSVKIDQHAGYTSLYNASNKRANEDTVGCLRVTYSGSLPAAVRLYASAGITNSSQFNLKVERGSGLTSPDASMGCAGFAASSTIYNGALSSFPSSWVAGAGAKPGGAAWTQNEAADYRFTVTPIDDATLNAHTSTTSTSAHDFTWEARGFGAYPNSVLTTSGLAAYWRLAEGSGTTAFDATGTNNGSYVNSPTLGQPSLLSTESDPSITGTGQLSAVDVPDSASLSSTSAVSVEAWIKPTTITGDYRYAIQKAGSYQLRIDDPGAEAGKISFFAFAGGTGEPRASTPTPANINQRYHVVGTYDGSAERLYVDGQLVTTVARTGVMPDNANPVKLGGRFIGGLDDISVYNRALSAAEVKQHYDYGN